MSCPTHLAASHHSLLVRHHRFCQNRYRYSGSMRCKAQGAVGPAPTYPGPILEGSQLETPMHNDNVVFYTHVLCPFAERVWLALLHHNVQHTLVCPFSFLVSLRCRSDNLHRAIQPTQIAILLDCVSLCLYFTLKLGI